MEAFNTKNRMLEVVHFFSVALKDLEDHASIAGMHDSLTRTFFWSQAVKMTFLNDPMLQHEGAHSN